MHPDTFAVLSRTFVTQGLLEHCTIILSRYQTYSTFSLERCGRTPLMPLDPSSVYTAKAPRECSLPCGKGTSPQAAEKIEVRAHPPRQRTLALTVTSRRHP